MSTSFHYQVPSERPTLSRTQTTYSGMNEWMNMRTRPMMSASVPLTMSDTNWREIRANPSLAYQPVSTQRPLSDNHRTDEFYRRYVRLADNIAYRYPNPGPARVRQGSIGGSWRHVKEVLAQGGSRVVFVDGLVRLYDHTLNNRPKSHSAAFATPMYAPGRADIQAQRACVEQGLRRPEPAEAFPPLKETLPRPETSKYKGFYTLRK